MAVRAGAGSRRHAESVVCGRTFATSA